mmetsp:Transcript_12084/g.42383  ORF Transcript_12084/g.42383 Transcript_12084/m.42383 type:complete len:217 (+) Transcript_12084:3470-4120(+)
MPTPGAAMARASMSPTSAPTPSPASTTPRWRCIGRGPTRMRMCRSAPSRARQMTAHRQRSRCRRRRPWCTASATSRSSHASTRPACTTSVTPTVSFLTARTRTPAPCTRMATTASVLSRPSTRRTRRRSARRGPASATPRAASLRLSGRSAHLLARTTSSPACRSAARRTRRRRGSAWSTVLPTTSACTRFLAQVRPRQCRRPASPLTRRRRPTAS